ncbi:MAG: thioesterase family protein [Solirubrobacteraceae bacterium]
MAEGTPIFRARDGLYEPTEQARGPWDETALHGGAPAALIARAFERHPQSREPDRRGGGAGEPSGGLRIARLGFELLRPVPFAPLRLEVRTIRPGRRVQELAAELYASGEDRREQLVCRASALRVAELPAGLPEPPPGALASTPMPGPEKGEPVRFALNPEIDGTSFAASAMEMRWLDDPNVSGPARVWQRLRHPLIEEEPASPLARLAASADFGNGVSASLPFHSYLFINADLHIHLHRPPQSEWIGIDARTLLHEGGTALSESILHDVHGPVGRGFQTLVVAPR